MVRECWAEATFFSTALLTLLFMRVWIVSGWTFGSLASAMETCLVAFLVRWCWYHAKAALADASSSRLEETVEHSW